MNLTKSQQKAVDKLFQKFISGANKVEFKAPTGSGKTFMATNLISKIFSLNKDKTMILVGTISDAELPKSFYRKINEYKKFLDYQNFSVEFLESPSKENKKIEQIPDIKLEKNKVIVFGTSSFGKNKLLSEQGILNNFVFEAKTLGWNIIYIRDEAHRSNFKKNKDDQEMLEGSVSVDNALSNIASLIIHMTATPKTLNNLVEITLEDMEEDGVKLLKDTSVKPFIIDQEGEENLVLDHAIKKFKNIQKEYKLLEQETGEYIRPAMLIQVRSKRKGNTSDDNKLEEEISKIIQKLTENSLTYLKYFSESKSSSNVKASLSLWDAGKNDSLYDVIIFKVGPSTGWDIPRACMLVQLRSVFSETLNIQTLGRIKRNPFPNLEYNPITDKYYLYSDYQERTRELEGYTLDSKFNDIKGYSGTIIKEDFEKVFLENKYWASILDILESDYFSTIYDECSSKKRMINKDESIFYKVESGSFESQSYIDNLIALRIYINNMIKSNKILFNNYIVDKIDEWCSERNKKKDFVYYVLKIQFEADLRESYKSNFEEVNRKELYKLNADVELLDYYQVWANKELPKKVENMNKFQNYGYQIVREADDFNNVQWLDSYAEMSFLKHFYKVLIEIQKNDLDFFAKMPTLGSKIKFEYFSKSELKYLNSFVDFMVIKNNKILMIEVKSHNDYDEIKTNELFDAYKWYMMQNYGSENEIVMCLVYAGKNKEGEELDSIIMIFDYQKNEWKKTTLTMLLINF